MKYLRWNLIQNQDNIFFHHHTTLSNFNKIISFFMFIVHIL